MGFDHVVATRVVVRVLDAAGEPVGAGFLLGPDLVATCAHVVADAAGGDPYAVEGPVDPLRVDFPMVDTGGGQVRDASVVRWVPIESDGSGDIALLGLSGPVPAGARMPPLRRIDQLWGHPFRVLGFPDGLADGVWSTGRIRGRQATGWFQLQVAAGDQPIVGGFSGSPVWDDESGAVVGMTVAADRTGETTTAYLIPIDQVLGTDPELMPCPYRGLEPFGEEHAEFFFGRDDGVAQVEEVLARQPLVAVAGPSGAGKSSLLRAGLLPRARSSGATVAELRPLPGQPIEELIAAALAAPPDDGRTIVLVDQFEELAAADPAGARRLLAALGDRLDGCERRADGTWPLQVVLTARSSTLEEVLAPEIATRLGAGTVLVPPMDRRQLRDAIVAPAERAPGLVFEPGLVDRILDDAAAEPGQLPLVESLLTELWERRAGGVLTIEAYERSGGVAGVVATRAEQVVAALDVAPDDPGLRRLFTALAGTDRDGRFVRRPLRTADVDPALRPLVDRLVAGRLLVVERPPAGEERVQLAHQALIEHWPRLRGWLAEDRDFVSWREEADVQRDRWEAAGRDDGALLRGVPLAATAEWLPRRTADVPVPLREFVARSRARQRREVRRWRVVTAVLAVLVLAAGALAAVAVARGAQVTEQLRLADAQIMAQSALDRLPGDPVTASALALAAHRSDPDNDTARTALSRLAFGMQSVDSVYPDVNRLPAGSLIVSGDGDTVVVRDSGQATVITGALGPAPEYWALPGLPPEQNRLILSNDGRALAGLDIEGRVLLWDIVGRSGPAVVSDGLGTALPRTLNLAPDPVRLSWLTLLPDRTRRLVVWDVRAAAAVPVGIPPISDPQVGLITLTADPGMLAEFRPAGLTIRSVADGAVRATLPPGAYAGYRYAVTCEPGATFVWDVVTGQQLRRLPRLADCTDDILKRELTPTGEFLVETRPGTNDRDLDRWRITSLHTGQAYELVAPPHTADAPQSGDVRRIDVAIVGDRLVGYDLWQRSLLRMHADPADARPGAIVTADARYEVSVDPEAGEITAVDAMTRGLAGVLPRAALLDSGDRQPTMNADSVGLITTSADHVSYAEYAVPGFSRIGYWTLPGGPVKQGAERPHVDSRGDRIVTLDNGVLAAWDRRTGLPIGAPIDLASDAERATNFFIGSEVRVRPGPAWEVAVAGPHGVELWDMSAGTRTAVLESQPIAIMFDDTGTRVAVVENDWSVQVWDVEQRRRIGVPFVTSAPFVLLGFTADGLLAGGTAPESGAAKRIFLIDPQTGRQRGGFTFPSDVDADTALTADGRLVVFDQSGSRPMMFPLDLRRWTDHLCGLVDRPFTDGERALLPASIDFDRPCG
jgi:conflict system STAND superfamily ATPase/trypsin-like peptidase